MYFWNLVKGWIYIGLAAFALIACLIVVEFRHKPVTETVAEDKSSSVDEVPTDQVDLPTGATEAQQEAPAEGDTTSITTQEEVTTAVADPPSQAPASEESGPELEAPPVLEGAQDKEVLAEEKPETTPDTAVTKQPEATDETIQEPSIDIDAPLETPPAEQDIPTTVGPPVTTTEPPEADTTKAAEVLPEEVQLPVPLDKVGNPLVLCAVTSTSQSLVVAENALGLAHDLKLVVPGETAVRLVAAGQVLKVNHNDPNRGLTIYIGLENSHHCAIYGGLASLTEDVKEGAELVCGAELGTPRAEPDGNGSLTFAILVYQDLWYNGTHIDPTPFLVLP